MPVSFVTILLHVHKSEEKKGTLRKSSSPRSRKGAQRWAFTSFLASLTKNKKEKTETKKNTKEKDKKKKKHQKEKRKNKKKKVSSQERRFAQNGRDEGFPKEGFLVL